jgi:hypothetical protein
MAFLLRRSLARHTRGSSHPAAVRHAVESKAPQALIGARPLLTHFVADAALLVDRLRGERLALPGVLVSAQKGGRRAAHEQMAALTGLELWMRDDLTHIMHLQQPSLAIDLVQEAIQAAAGPCGPPPPASVRRHPGREVIRPPGVTAVVGYAPAAMESAGPPMGVQAPGPLPLPLYTETALLPVARP